MNLYHELLRFDKVSSEVDSLTGEALNSRITNYAAFTVYTSMAIIKLHDAWTVRCREIIRKSSLGGYQTTSGQLLSRSSQLTRLDEPVDWLRRNWTPKKGMPKNWEPDWHIPAQSIRAARLLNIQNYNALANALGAITIIEQLRWTRNVLVHSLPSVYSMYRQLLVSQGFSRDVNPCEFVYFRISGSGPMLIDSWIAELRLAITAAIR